MPLLDTLSRPLRSLRVSVTDRCNLRCEYCMPEEEYSWLPRSDFLSFDELERIVAVFVSLGVQKVRLTGGEPLLRPDLPALVQRLARNAGIQDLALTTNGTLLKDAARDLRRAGLRRLTVSLDTLRPDRFEQLSRRRAHSHVLEGLEAAARAEFETLRIDSVLLRGLNEDEVSDLLRIGRELNAEVRFIEYMDVAGATRWSEERVVSRDEILARVASTHGAITPLSREAGATAERFRLRDGTTFGIIASTSQPFCRDCDRSRLSADGQWFRCLYATEGTDLRTPLRSLRSNAEIRELVAEHWRKRRDRGAELRRGLSNRRAFVPLEQLRLHPHWEMHKKGG